MMHGLLDIHDSSYFSWSRSVKTGAFRFGCLRRATVLDIPKDVDPSA